MNTKIKFVLNNVKLIFNKIIWFFKVYNLYAVLAIAFWYAPSWLAFFIPSLKPFALTWLGLLTSPIIPVVVVVPLTAVLFRWIHKQLIKLVKYIRDLMKKVGLAQLMLNLFTLEEYELILEKGKVMKKIKDDDTKEFKEAQSLRRKEMILNDWETKLEE